MANKRKIIEKIDDILYNIETLWIINIYINISPKSIDYVHCIYIQNW